MDLQFKKYVQDVLGIRSFIWPQEMSAPTPVSSGVVSDSIVPLIFFRVKTNSDSILNGELGQLFVKIKASLKRADSDIKTLEIESYQSEEGLKQIASFNPQVVVALGEEASSILTEGSYFIVKSVDPALISKNVELKKILWEDLKKSMKSLGWS